MDCKAPISEPPTIEAFHLPTSTQSHAAECRVLFVLRKATNVHGWVHMYTVEPTLQPCGLASFFSAKSTVKICKGVFYRRSVPVTAVNGITSPDLLLFLLVWFGAADFLNNLAVGRQLLYGLGTCLVSALNLCIASLQAEPAPDGDRKVYKGIQQQQRIPDPHGVQEGAQCAVCSVGTEEGAQLQRPEQVHNAQQPREKKLRPSGTTELVLLFLQNWGNCHFLPCSCGPQLIKDVHNVAFWRHLSTAVEAGEHWGNKSLVHCGQLLPVKPRIWKIQIRSQLLSDNCPLVVADDLCNLAVAAFLQIVIRVPISEHKREHRLDETHFPVPLHVPPIIWVRLCHVPPVKWAWPPEIRPGGEKETAAATVAPIFPVFPIGLRRRRLQY
mmetsp:Transcript_65441/g.108870  ORF Transcript_65441/g.108870 Transcript_65441/m.108870 type:complete len:384 (-) Transcript_65441:851-2002(-)